MSYKNKTRFYKIPYMAHGDMLTQQSQKHQMTIIDNLLYASTFGASKCIIEDGLYSLQKKENSNLYRLKVSPYHNKYSAIGILNYRLYLQQGDYYSNYFKMGAYYYVYLSYNSNMQISPDLFNVQIKLKEIDNNNDTYLKICQIDCTGQKPILKDDVNKVLAKNVLAHTQDFTNPHGQILIQKELKVQNTLKLKQQQIYPVVYDVINSGGNEGVVWKKQGCIPVYATIYGQENVGQIFWKISGNELIVKNNGDKGILLNLRVQVKYE